MKTQLRKPEMPSSSNCTMHAEADSRINFACISAWAGFGVVLRSYLRKTVYLRIFNVTMAILLVLSLYPLLSKA